MFQLTFLLSEYSYTINMPIADLVGWIGNIFFIIGVTDIANQKIKGFYMNSVGNLAYIIQGIMTSTYSLLMLSIWLLGINVYGVYNWSRKE